MLYRILGVLLLFSNLSCGTKAVVVQSPLTESYALLNEGQNAKAIKLLEKELARHPDNDEVRLVLASAYAGEAGVDVITIYDSFKDLLFAKPLKNSILQGPEESSRPADGPVPIAAVKPKANAASENKDEIQTPVKKFSHEIYQFLDSLQRALGYIEKFPRVTANELPLIARALQLLDAHAWQKDVTFYRAFLRVLYLKESYLEKITNDEHFGTSEWICTLDLRKFGEELAVIGDDLLKVTKDLKEVYPNKSSYIDDFYYYVMIMDGTLKTSSTHSPAGSQSGTLLLEGKLRSFMRCGEGANG